VIGDALAGAGVLAATAAAVVVLLSAPSPRRAAAMLVALALLIPLVLGDQWDSARVVDVRDDAGRAVAFAMAAIAAVSVLAFVFHRYPLLFPLAAIATLPFRIPLHAGGDQANLLVPLYLVIAAGAIATAVRDLRQPASDHLPPPLGEWLQRVLAAVVALYALQSLYSDDFSKALQNICFFMVPFSMLFVLLREQRWNHDLLRGVLLVIIAEAAALAAFGLWEYADRDLLWNPEVIRSNELHTYFRVNSLFWDPNIYGRYLVLAILALVSVLLWTSRQRVALACSGLCLLLWLGLATTFSQSSFVALLGGLAVLAALRWSLRWTALAGVSALAVGLVVALAAGSSLNIDLSTERKLNKDTSGRANLVSGGVELFGDRPLWGYGSGSFAASFRDQQKGGRPAALAASHTEPVTVAAEQGVPGLLLYVALLAVAFAVLLGGLAGLVPGISGRGPPTGEVTVVARVAVLVAFTALVLHTFAYAAFLTDPIAWALLAIGAALNRMPPPQLPLMRAAPKREPRSLATELAGGERSAGHQPGRGAGVG
jgi:putative inorganic carbon (hco3(-)) transporter